MYWIKYAKDGGARQEEKRKTTEMIQGYSEVESWCDSKKMIRYDEL